jgi:hypothetical protein
MKTLIAWLTRRQRCACGAFKLPRAAACFDCTATLEDGIRDFFAESKAKNRCIADTVDPKDCDCILHA